LQELGELHVKAGVKPGAELASKISEETGMSYRWVMKYLPDNFKERPGVGGPPPVFNLTNIKEKLYEGKVAHRAIEEELLRAPPEKQILSREEVRECALRKRHGGEAVLHEA
jgi:hypothetical protein